MITIKLIEIGKRGVGSTVHLCWVDLSVDEVFRSSVACLSPMEMELFHLVLVVERTSLENCKGNTHRLHCIYGYIHVGPTLT